MYSKLIALLLVVSLIFCGTCSIDDTPFLEEGLTDWSSPPCTLLLTGQNNFNENAVTGSYLVALAQGMESGVYFNETKGTKIIGKWKGILPPYTNWTFIWQQSLGEITPTCGLNSDTCIFTTTEKLISNGQAGDSFYLDTASLCKYYTIIDTTRTIASNSAKTTYTPVGSLVKIIWGVHCHIIPQASSCEVTDTMAYTLIFGTAFNRCVAIDNIEFYWANGDTTSVGTTHRQEYAPDFGWAYNFILGQDTIRTLANDTCLGIGLMRTDGKTVAWDTLDRYKPAGKAASYEFQIVMIRNL